VSDKEILGLQDQRLRFLEAWMRTPKGWKFVAWQSTSMPA